MSYSFLNAQGDVASLINQDLSGDTQVVTLTEVKRWLNQAYVIAQMKLIKIRQGFSFQESYTDLVANQNDYQIPSDMLKLERVEIGYSSATDRTVANQIQLNDMREDTFSGGSSMPFFALNGTYIRIFPTPATGSTSGLRIFYAKQKTVLSANGDIIDLPAGYEHIITYHAGMLGKIKLGLFDEATNLKTLFNIELDNMEQDVIDRSNDNTDQVRMTANY